jgi:two-component system, NarL family, sensor histidine kinase DevS
MNNAETSVRLSTRALDRRLCAEHTGAVAVVKQAVAPGAVLGLFGVSSATREGGLTMALPRGPAASHAPDRESDILRERDRIAAELQDQVIQQVYAIGLNLQSTASQVADPLARRRIGQAIDDLDQLVHILRDAVFGLQTRLKDRGLLAGILHLCEQLKPTPDVTFRGPANGTLHPATSAWLLDLLADALVLIGDQWTPVAIDVTAADGAHVTTLRAVPRVGAAAAGEPDGKFLGLRDRAAKAGMRIQIEPSPERVQISWHAA